MCVLPKLISNKIVGSPVHDYNFLIDYPFPSSWFPMIQNERASWLHFLNVTKEVQIHKTVLVCVCCDTHVKRGNYRYVNTIYFADLLIHDAFRRSGWWSTRESPANLMRSSSLLSFLILHMLQSFLSEKRQQWHHQPDCAATLSKIFQNQNYRELVMLPNIDGTLLACVCTLQTTATGVWVQRHSLGFPY